MALSINSICSLKPPSLPPSPQISPLHVRLARNDPTGDGIRSRCMSLAAACLVIGCVGAASAAEGTVPVSWSDKIRKCPPWRVNSLENVMPENLPRRSGSPKTDGFVADRTAPAPAVGFSKGCYSL